MHAIGATAGAARSPVALAVGIIERARRRQRRRRARLAGLCLAAVTVGVVAYVITHAHQAIRPVDSPGAKATIVVPGVLDPQRPPYMGVACPVANSIACDRVGLAIWLRRPAVSVTATIAAQPLKLSWAGDLETVSALGPRKAFDGFLRRAGIVENLHVRPDGRSNLWFGGDQPSPTVTLRIHYPDGTAVSTRLNVDLNTGWG